MTWPRPSLALVPSHQPGSPPPTYDLASPRVPRETKTGGTEKKKKKVREVRKKEKKGKKNKKKKRRKPHKLHPSCACTTDAWANTFQLGSLTLQRLSSRGPTPVSPPPTRCRDSPDDSADSWPPSAHLFRPIVLVGHSSRRVPSSPTASQDDQSSQGARLRGRLPPRLINPDPSPISWPPFPDRRAHREPHRGLPFPGARQASEDAS